MKLAAALVTVYVVWGSTYLAIAVAERTMPPLLMLSVRFAVAGALLLVWSFRRGAARPSRREWVGGAVGSAYARVAPLPRSPLLAAAMQMLCAGVMLGVAGVGSGELGRVHLEAVSPASLGALAYLVVVGSLLAFTAYGWLLKNASTP